MEGFLRDITEAILPFLEPVLTHLRVETWLAVLC